jgi:hypothetical protein
LSSVEEKNRGFQELKNPSYHMIFKSRKKRNPKRIHGEKIITTIVLRDFFEHFKEV